MAPECYTQPDTVDERSDLYALGAVGYFMLTGSHVFGGASLVEVCSHHLHSAPTPPSQRLGVTVPERLEGAILKCLSKTPTDRPASAEALSGLLGQCTDVGGLSLDHARQWWNAHRVQLLPTGQTTNGIASTKTIAVDLKARGSR